MFKSVALRKTVDKIYVQQLLHLCNFGSHMETWTCDEKEALTEKRNEEAKG